MRTAVAAVVACAWSASVASACPTSAEGVTVEAGRLRVDAPIRFDLYAGTLDPSALPVIDAVGRRMRACPEVALEIQVHTDTRRTEGFNMARSQVIADLIRARLVSQGIAASRLTARGYGESQPEPGREGWDPTQTRVVWLRR
jgi:OOP family OmpA-OmpF porin